MHSGPRMLMRPLPLPGRRSSLTVLVVAAMLLAGAQPTAAGAANSYFKNSAVADVAERSPELSHGGQCIRFVREVLRKVSGGRVFISAYASGYQGTFKANGGNVVSSAAAAKGDVIQITPPRTSDSWKGPERMPLHTAIVRRNLGGGNFSVIDSNYSLNNDELVRRHSLNPYSMARRYGGGTVRIWRMGSTPSASKPVAPKAPPPPPPPPPTTKPAPKPAPTVSNILKNDARLVASKNQYLRSPDGRYRFVMQQDSNLVLYGPSGRALWASNTVGRGADHVRMQGDGNLVIYTAKGKPIWASNTAGHYKAHLVVQNDGNVVIYEGKTPLWATGTDGRT